MVIPSLKRSVLEAEAFQNTMTLSQDSGIHSNCAHHLFSGLSSIYHQPTVVVYLHRGLTKSQRIRAMAILRGETIVDT